MDTSKQAVRAYLQGADREGDWLAALAGVEALLRLTGNDPERPGLKETPRRVVEALVEMTAGQRTEPDAVLATVFEDVRADQMVVVRDISFVSLCEHHLLPFLGVAHVGYLPAQGRVVGLSKLPRLVRGFAARLQVQERLTEDIAHAIERKLSPLGVGVVIEASHQCTACRGVKANGSVMVTSCLLGVLRDHARSEFLALARG